jgi:endonuclease/exonuclease/phosphatase family metal-dependent hydrolase
MRIVTLNTWKNEGAYDVRLDAMAAGLRALDADVIALQECFVADSLDLDTAARVAEATGLHLTRRTMRAKPRDHGCISAASRSDLALLTRAVPDMVGGAAFRDEPRDRDRGILTIDIMVGDKSVRFGCTHFTHIQDEAAAEIRHTQATEAVVALLVDCDGPAILMGDVNAVPGDDCLGPLLDHPALDPQSRTAAFVAITRRPSPSRVLSGHIDHILLFNAQNHVRFAARSLALVADYKQLHLGPSDHPAIVADLEIL